MSLVAGKVVVVTGAASGFGALVAQMLRERGAEVVGFDVHEAEGCWVVGVTDRTAVADAVDRVVQEHGSVDVLVNNAGVMPARSTARRRLRSSRSQTPCGSKQTGRSR